MSLLVTSCTMGRQPDRLLNKGPQYLRTRTNSGLFDQDRKSAVESLAASKSQFYATKSSVNLDKQQDLAVPEKQDKKYIQSIKRKKEPTRSKSEFDLCLLQLVTEEENDENNNEINDDYNKLHEDDVVDASHSLNKCTVEQISKSPNAAETQLIFSSHLHKEDTLNPILTISPSFGSDPTQTSELQPDLKSLHSSEEISVINERKPQSLNDEVDTAESRKPVPLPRRFKSKPPVPLPRKLSNKTSPVVTNQGSNSCPPETASSPNLLSNSLRLEKPTPETKEEFNHTFVETLTGCSTFVTTNTVLPLSDKPLQLSTEVGQFKNNNKSQNSYIYNSKQNIISDQDSFNQKSQLENVSKDEDEQSSCPPLSADKLIDVSPMSGDNKEHIKAQKKCPDILASAKAVKRERISVGPCIPSPPSGSLSLPPVAVAVIENKRNFLLNSKLEMSIESVDQAVYESEISALPSASMEASSLYVSEQEAREITRSNSSLSGKNEPKSTSPLSASPTPYCSTVPRSYSDISCQLEGQHSRESSVVSNHSRLSRASVGTDLENFFNQMGLEKGVLEPISRFKDLQPTEVFDSMSSLDSHDAASICSTYSRSEQEWSDSQSTERSQQQTSVIERNARIIKWLCNVRKAKNQSQSSEYAATSNA